MILEERCPESVLNATLSSLFPAAGFFACGLSRPSLREGWERPNWTVIGGVLAGGAALAAVGIPLWCWWRRAHPPAFLALPAAPGFGPDDGPPGPPGPPGPSHDGPPGPPGPSHRWTMVAITMGPSCSTSTGPMTDVERQPPPPPHAR